MHPAPSFRGTLSDADLGLLRDFVSIVAAGGITAAEARLGKGKSAISLGLSRLESRLSVRLCERGRSGFRLTEQGQIVHAACLQLFSDIGRFSDVVGSATRKMEAQLTFLADDSFVFEHDAVLSGVIARFNRRFSGLRLNIRMTSPDRIFSDVLEGGADLGFTALIRPSEAFEIFPVCSERMGIFCGKDHPLFAADDRALSYDRLRSFDFVAAHVTQEDTFSEFVRGLKITATAPTILSRMLMVMSSRYLGVIPLPFAAHWVGTGMVRELRMTGSRTSNICSLIRRRGRPVGIGSDALWTMLGQALRAHED